MSYRRPLNVSYFLLVPSLFVMVTPKDIKQMNLFELVLESEAIEQKQELMRDEDGREYEQRGIQCYCTLALSFSPNYDATPTQYIYSS